jgi:hypothetical protein
VARAAVSVATAAVALWPAPAQAHLGSTPLPDSSYYQTTLAGVRPQPPGVTASVTANGEWAELRNDGTADVIVFGYGGEPYLRITRTGVWRNAVSPTAYLNESLFVDNSALVNTRGTVAPSWTKVGAGDSIRWHDHRIHWMGPGRPPPVDADPRRPQLIGDWVIHATAGARPFTINGSLRWIGKPAQVLGLPTGMAITLVSIAGGGVLLTAASAWVLRGLRPGTATDQDRQLVGGL